MSNESQVVKENRAAVCHRVLDLQNRVRQHREKAVDIEAEAYELIRQLRHASAEDIVFDGSVYQLSFTGGGDRMRKMCGIEVIQ